MSVYRRTPPQVFPGAPGRSRAVELLERIPAQRAHVFLIIIVGALFAFETFNYGTTEFAMLDLLGDLNFLGLRWASILAIAFCAIDFAGIARLFTPEQGGQEPVEVWYLLGAWLLAATMNALLTWWAISLALLGHNGLGNEILGRESLLRTVPIFVAVLVWLIRVLIIGTLTLAGERMIHLGQLRRLPASRNGGARPVSGEARPRPNPRNRPRPVRPAPKPPPRQEPRYVPDSVSARPGRRH